MSTFRRIAAGAHLPIITLLAVLGAGLTATPAALAGEFWAAGAARRGATTTVRVSCLSGATVETYILDSFQGLAGAPAVAAGAGGRAAAAWVREESGTWSLAASAYDGRSWSPPVVLVSSASPLTTPAVGLAGGHVWLAWATMESGDDDIAAARWKPGSVPRFWSLARPGAPDILPSIGTSGGRVTVSWLGLAGGSYQRLRSRFASGAFSAPAAVVSSEAAAADAMPEIPDGLLAEVGDEVAPSVAWTEGDTSGAARPGAWISSDPCYVEQDDMAIAAVSPYDRTYIMGLGDSLTWGRGSSADGPPTDYVSRLESRLKGPWIAVNRGYPGEQSAGTLGRVDCEMNIFKPGLTILLVGMNDTYYGVSSATIVSNIEMIGDRILAGGGRLVLCTVPPVIPWMRPTQWDRLELLNPAIVNLAVRRGWTLVNLWQLIRSRANWERRYMHQLSGNHLNNRGYEFIARKFRAAILNGNLMTGMASWRAWDPLVPGQLLAEDNAGAAFHVDDPFTPLGGSDVDAVGTLDPDGDGVDSLAVVRNLDAAQTLTIYSAPTAGMFSQEQLMSAVQPLAEVDWLDPDGGWITHVFGFDQDGDGRDELGIVRFKVRGGQTLQIWRAFQPDLPAPELVVHDAWTIPAKNRIRDIAAIQADADPAEELLVLSEADLTGEQSLLIWDTPQPGSEPPPEANNTPLLYRNDSLRRGILQVAGQDITPGDGLGLDEILLVRSVRRGRVDRLDAFVLPDFTAPAAPLALLARDRWVRLPGPHQLFMKDLGLSDGLGGVLRTTAIWLNP